MGGAPPRVVAGARPRRMGGWLGRGLAAAALVGVLVAVLRVGGGAPRGEGAAVTPPPPLAPAWGSGVPQAGGRGRAPVWRVGPVVLRPTGGGGFDSVAVKDPSLLLAGGEWHVFYTARGPAGYSIGHVSAPRLEDLASSRRTRLHLPASAPLLPGRNRYPCAAPQASSRAAPLPAAALLAPGSLCPRGDERPPLPPRPKVFYFRPHRTYYVVYQTSESNYQPAYSTNANLSNPAAWSPPRHLAREHRLQDTAKWIDFWHGPGPRGGGAPGRARGGRLTSPRFCHRRVLCSGPSCYLFFTRAHRAVWAMEAPMSQFPLGFGPPRRVFGPVFEAAHVYAAQGAPRGEAFHMLFELRGSGRGRRKGGKGAGGSARGKAEADLRRYGLATAPHPLGPWTVREEPWAAEQHLQAGAGGKAWTEEVSHGELVRAGRDERLEVDARAPSQLVAQGLLHAEHMGEYTELPWRLGLLERPARYG